MMYSVIALPITLWNLDASISIKTEGCAYIDSNDTKKHDLWFNIFNVEAENELDDEEYDDQLDSIFKSSFDGLKTISLPTNKYFTCHQNHRFNLAIYVLFQDYRL